MLGIINIEIKLETGEDSRKINHAFLNKKFVRKLMLNSLLKDRYIIYCFFQVLKVKMGVHKKYMTPIFCIIFFSHFIIRLKCLGKNTLKVHFYKDISYI